MPLFLLFLLSLVLPLSAQPPTSPSDIDELFYHLHQQDLQELKRLSEKRLEMLKNREAALQREKEATLKVAILGNSALKYTEEGFNAEALQLLLNEMKGEEPEAVFFMGPLVAPGANYDHFIQLIKGQLGSIPFYPTPDSKEIVDKFNLPVSAEFQKGYTVLLKNTFFALFSAEEGNLEPLFNWLETNLQGRFGAYRFVLGSTAAFSTQATEGNFQGLDRWPLFRSQFWNLLRNADVAAYFASNEVVYDRSYRTGVWQILTGGAGATRTYNVRDDTFYHFLTLTIPQDGQGPIVEAFDIRGRKRDSWKLNATAPAISQFRISVTNN